MQLRELYHLGHFLFRRSTIPASSHHSSRGLLCEHVQAEWQATGHDSTGNEKRIFKYTAATEPFWVPTSLCPRDGNRATPTKHTERRARAGTMHNAARKITRMSYTQPDFPGVHEPAPWARSHKPRDTPPPGARTCHLPLCLGELHRDMTDTTCEEKTKEWRLREQGASVSKWDGGEDQTS